MEIFHYIRPIFLVGLFQNPFSKTIVCRKLRKDILVLSISISNLNLNHLDTFLDLPFTFIKHIPHISIILLIYTQLKSIPIYSI